MQKRLWTILLLTSVASCGSCGEEASMGAPESDASTASEAAGATEGAAVDDDMPSPDDPEEFVDAYETLVTDLVEVARAIEDEDDARERAPAFAADVRRMKEISEQFEGENAMKLGMAFARRARDLTELGAELATEMQRIQETPGLARAFSEALDAYEEGN